MLHALHRSNVSIVSAFVGLLGALAMRHYGVDLNDVLGMLGPWVTQYLMVASWCLYACFLNPAAVVFFPLFRVALLGLPKLSVELFYTLFFDPMAILLSKHYMPDSHTSQIILSIALSPVLSVSRFALSSLLCSPGAPHPLTLRQFVASHTSYAYALPLVLHHWLQRTVHLDQFAYLATEDKAGMTTFVAGLLFAHCLFACSRACAGLGGEQGQDVALKPTPKA